MNGNATCDWEIQRGDERFQQNELIDGFGSGEDKQSSDEFLGSMDCLDYVYWYTASKHLTVDIGQVGIQRKETVD
ncbi:hypothetical protein DVH05_011523 [Phytophthora capsici]|nr:hypothetical protein DVH05_011523 [Phytophthora capsici]